MRPTFEQWYDKYAHWDSIEEAREAYAAIMGENVVAIVSPTASKDKALRELIQELYGSVRCVDVARRLQAIRAILHPDSHDCENWRASPVSPAEEVREQQKKWPEIMEDAMQHIERAILDLQVVERDWKMDAAALRSDK